MGTQKRKSVVHGIAINQIQFQQGGEWYTPVDDRIVLANHAAPAQVRTQAGYSVISHQIIPVGAERWAYTCTIEYPHGSEHYYPGSDFIDLSAKDGLAKAETSAIGRALGLAGIAIESGIASAEEMSRIATHQQPAHPATQAAAATAAQRVNREPQQPSADAAPDDARPPDEHLRDGIALDNGVLATVVDQTALRETATRAGIDLRAFTLAIPDLCDGRAFNRITKGDMRMLDKLIHETPERFAAALV